MSITHIRDPRDLLPSILSPQANVAALDETAYVQHEVDDGLRVMFNTERQKFVVLDTKAPGGPSSQYVMVVQNPDGSFRLVDNRTIETLRKLRFGHKQSAEELIHAELSKQRADDKRRSEYGEHVADIVRHAGHDITSSVASRQRTREHIRKEAV